MNVQGYLDKIPEIERLLRANKPDALVCGMGPTAWLLRWIDQSLLAGVRLFGCHDGCRILPMDDLIVMDMPRLMLNPDTTRFQNIVEARPKRLWVYEPALPVWKDLLNPAVASITKPVPWSICRPDRIPPGGPDKIKFKLETEPLHTTSISPTGMTTLAWREGCRRIGLIGVDMQKHHHHTYSWRHLVDSFFVKMAEQAHERGGAIFNLSPITSLGRFAAWTPPSTSTSVPTSGSETQEPSASSNTPSTSTPPAPSASTGCDQEIPASR